MKYIPTQVISDYSLLTSFIKISDYINFALEKELQVLFLTDDNLNSSGEFYFTCLKNNIRPIIGLKIIINDEKYSLYAKNYESYKALVKLSTLKSERSLLTEDLVPYASKFIGIVNKEAYQKSLPFNMTFLGYENLVQKQELQNLYPKARLLFVNEVKALKKVTTNYLKYLSLIKGETYQNSDNNYWLTDEEYLENTDKEVLHNLEIIIKECNLEFPKQDLLPIYPLEEGTDPNLFLAKLCQKGLEKRFNNNIETKYKARLFFELDIIKKMNFSNYFLVVYDFVKYAKKNNILVGPGRGSAASSLISYALGITDIDPIKYDLLFERFLNPERISMPDIDIDFDAEKRDLVVAYVKEKYGLKKVAGIITYGTLATKQALRDAAKILEIENTDVEKIINLVNEKSSLKDQLNNNNNLKKSLENAKLFNMYDVAAHIEGLKRHTSIHAAGIVIAKDDIDNYIPLVKNNDSYLTGFTMEYLEPLGLLKMDFLSLKNLTLVNQVINDLNKKNIALNWNNIPLDDIDTLKLFETGNTLGIFQFESSGMINFLKKLKVTSFDDLVAAVALFRPGPMQNIDTFINRKSGSEAFVYYHPKLEPILKPTYGIIVYQEQIMQIANIMAGYSLGEADILRRAMSKKKREVLEKEEQKFLSRSKSLGFSDEVSKEVYQLILKFADYGFNKAHSVSYAILGYKMAYLKVHYSAYFLAALLKSVIGSENKTNDYLREALNYNLKIASPNINKSSYDYEVINNQIYFSLGALKNIGITSVNDIVNERSKGLYIDIFDFVARTYGRSVTTKTIGALIDAGAFDDFGYNHATLHGNIEAAINYAELAKEINVSLLEKPKIINYPEFAREELLQREKTVFGFYFNNHPTQKYILKYNTLTVNNYPKYFDKNVKVILYLENKKEVNTKNNKQMLFVKASDFTGTTDLILFPETYQKYHGDNLIGMYMINGKITKRFANYQITVNNLQKLQD